ncbi:M56 family metallopeptidase [Lacinutrix algicola]|uniref:M56 family metallopeptidase n=1 Tax=Lacinutrix algicola TaxID=342954 RepID=UPI0006E401CF|nr:M56 family metallopeptidase [Lacinutrix algicola]
MEILILKSAACLAILIAFYKLFLERLSIHKFKRFYLLAALVISIVIPFITFVEYIEPIYNVETLVTNSFTMPQYFPTETIIEEPTNYLPILLWSIYGLGALLFASKFAINLFGIVSKINRNEKQKHNNFISVLLNDLIVPHTFFSYIFLNKTKFETKAIPEEVLLHEQTHAKQKHTLDILFIELLQIVFWFNPLLYIIKKDIKLNHEFLADEAVLKQGIDSSTYQETLLQFTSTANQMPLAHAINYSLIKKRFTIMKTQTSRKAIWLRSLLLLPLLGGLLFSFSGREQVEKDAESITIKTPTIQEYKISKKDYAQISYNYYQNKSEDNLNAILMSHKKMVEIYTNLEYKDKLKVNSPVNLSNELSIKSITREEKTTTNIPVLELKQNPLNLILNGKQTSLTTIKEDFIKVTNGDKSVLKIEAKGAVDYDIIKSIMSIISKDYLINIKLSEEAYIHDNTDYSSQNPTLTVNGITCDGCQLNLSKEGIKNIILSTTTGENILSFKFKYPGKPTESIKGNVLNETAVAYITAAKKGDVVQFFDIKTATKQKLKPVIVTIVDKDDINYSHSPIVKKGEQSILPPPPPPPTKAPQYIKGKKLTLNEIIDKTPEGVESGFEMLKNGESHYFTVYQGRKTYYNKDGYITDENGKILPPPPPAPPAPPKSTVEHAKEMANINADFYYNGKSISSDKAIKLLENNSKMNISTHSNNGKRTVNLSNKPITTVNGKVVNNEPQTGSLDINGERHFYSIKNGITRYYNTSGAEVDKNGKALKTSNKNNKDSFFEDRKSTYQNERKARIQERKKILEERKTLVEDRKKERETLLEERKEILENRRNQIRRPLSEQFKGMEANGTTFFYEGEKISEAKAIALVKENPKLNVSMQTNNGVSTVHLSKKGITTVNGKLVKKEE